MATRRQCFRSNNLHRLKRYPVDTEKIIVFDKYLDVSAKEIPWIGRHHSVRVGGFRDGIPVPVIAQRDAAPTQLIDVIKCQCKALGKKCSTDACSCHKEHMSCTSYCNCSGKDGWCNQYTNTEDAQAGDESAEMVDVDDDEDLEDEDDYVEDLEDENDVDDGWV